MTPMFFSSEMALRLKVYSNDSSMAYWGMVQIRHLGNWAGVCEITDREAKVICKQLNSKYKDGIALFASRWTKPTADFGLKEPVYSLRKMNCPVNGQGIQSCRFEDVCKLTPFCHTNGFAHVLCTTRPVYDGKTERLIMNDADARPHHADVCSPPLLVFRCGDIHTISGPIHSVSPFVMQVV
jgi:hypothetical protein